MNIEFNSTIQDIIDFNLFHMAHSSSIKKQLLLMRVLVGLSIPLVSCAFYIIIFHSINVFIVICSAFAGLVAFADYPRTNRKIAIGRIRKMLSEGDNQALLGHRAISLSPDGMFIKTSIGESKIIWSAIDKVAQNNKHIFLYTSSINALVIPKNCFKSEKEKQEFLEYVNTYHQQK